MTQLRGRTGQRPVTWPKPSELETPACNLCGQVETELVCVARDWDTGEPDRHPVVRCRGCSLMFAKPRPREEWLRQYYARDQSRGRFAHAPLRQAATTFLRRQIFRTAPGYRAQTNLISRALRAMAFPIARRLAVIPPWGHGRVLDIGCASGEWLAEAARLGLDCVGIELNRQAAEIARTVRKLEVVESTLFDADFPDKHFFTALLSHVLEHLCDPLATLREVHRVLQPGGTVIIVVPNLACQEAILLAGSWGGFDMPVHLYHFTPGTLAAMLERAGFEVTELHGRAVDFHGLRRSLRAYRSDECRRGRRPPPYLELLARWATLKAKCLPFPATRIQDWATMLTAYATRIG